MSASASGSATAAVILAAGASTRMGRPKALLQWGGRPFVAHAIALARAAGCEPVVVVEGACVLPPEVVAGAIVARNLEWSRGPLSSLQTGLAVALQPPEVAAVLVLTVDRPHLRAQTVIELVAAARDGAEIWQPEHDGVRGHPLVYPRAAAAALGALPPTASARELLRAPPWRDLRRTLGVDDPAVTANLDTPEDLRRAGIHLDA